MRAAPDAQPKTSHTASMKVALIAAMSLAAGCGGHGARHEVDPPRIEPWMAIGSARIGSTVDDIRRVYGKPISSAPSRAPVGTKYFGRNVIAEVYRVHGGKLTVTYVDGVAKELLTNSPRYRLADGLGVGTWIRRGTCAPTEGGGCQYSWRTFEFDECGNAWVGGTVAFTIALYLDRSLYRHPRARVSWIDFGDSNVVLYCF